MVSADAGPLRRCDLLIHGAVVVTADAGQPVIRDGAVAITAGRIAAVGRTEDVRALFEADKQLLARGKVVTPGLVNSHLHVSQHLLRGFVPLTVKDNRSYLFDWVFPYYAALGQEEEYLAATLAGCDLLRHGITLVADGGTVRHPGAVADGLASTGIRAFMGTWAWDHPATPERLSMNTAQALDRINSALSEISGRHDRVRPLVSTVGLGLSSDALLVGAKALADEHGTFLDFHQSFDEDEVQSHSSAFGPDVAPVEHLERLGVLSNNVRLIHQLITDDHEWDAIQDAGASVVRCTGTRAGRDLAALRARGIPVGVGTDTVNVSNTSDVLRAAHVFAAQIREPDNDDAGVVTVDDLFGMCTIAGARTLGAGDFLGSLEVGKRADLVVFDARRPEWTPLLDPISQLVLSADGGSVESVLIDGEFVLDRGQVVGVDEGALYEEAESAAANVLERMNATARIEKRALR